MIKKITLFFTFILSLSVFSQEQEGDKPGTIFYSSIEQTDSSYNLYIDLFQPERTKYIEAELFDNNNVKLSSILVELIKEEKAYYIVDEEKETKKKVVVQDINLVLNKANSDVDYPKVKIKLLNKDYTPIDFSQKIFY